MNNGRDPRTGESLHPNSSDQTLANFTNYEEFEAEYYKQLKYYISLEMMMENTIDELYAKYLEEPLAAALGCPTTTIPRGVPMKKGGAKYDFTRQQTIGTANIANSLYAVKY